LGTSQRTIDVPIVITISNENGIRWLDRNTEFHQCRTLLEWAISSKDAGELLPLPKEFRQHVGHPFRHFDSGTGLPLFSQNS
jgi:hypothetical protein